MLHSIVLLQDALKRTCENIQLFTPTSLHLQFYHYHHISGAIALCINVFLWGLTLQRKRFSREQFAASTPTTLLMAQSLEKKKS